MVQRERKIITIVFALKRSSTVGKGEGKEERVRVGVSLSFSFARKRTLCVHTLPHTCTLCMLWESQKMELVKDRSKFL